MNDRRDTRVNKSSTLWPKVDFIITRISSIALFPTVSQDAFSKGDMDHCIPFCLWVSNSADR